MLTDYLDIQFISLLGHTSGSIAVMYESNLFAGDLVMNMPFPLYPGLQKILPL